MNYFYLYKTRFLHTHCFAAAFLTAWLKIISALFFVVFLSSYSISVYSCHDTELFFNAYIIISHLLAHTKFVPGIPHSTRRAAQAHRPLFTPSGNLLPTCLSPRLLPTPQLLSASTLPNSTSIDSRIVESAGLCISAHMPYTCFKGW